VAIVPNFTGKTGDDFYAVFDGHRGRCVAQHAAETLHECLKTALNEGKAPEAALSDAFAHCHRSAREAGHRSGTCVVCFATVGGQGWCANVGDCRAVLSRTEAHVECLSTDHKASDQSETARIRACGGVVEFGCLDGALAVSRGLGNFDLCSEGFSQVPALAGPLDGMGSADPIGASSSSSAAAASEAAAAAAARGLLVLASDGVWDVFSDADACAFLRSRLRSGGTVSSACEALVAEAFERGSNDDKSVIVVCIGTGDGEAAAAAQTTSKKRARDDCDVSYRCNQR